MKNMYSIFLAAGVVFSVAGCRRGNSYENIVFPSSGNQAGQESASEENADQPVPRASRRGETIEFNGTVKRVDLEGGFYAIAADNGKKYVPSNLYENFSTDGLRVRVKARLRKEIMGIHMYGVPIDIITIEALPKNEV